MNAPISYERGDAREESLGLDRNQTQGTDTDLSVPDAFLELTSDQYWEWLTSLVDDGSELDQQLDELLDRVYDCQPAFYNPAGYRRLKSLLNELHDARDAVRAYEYDVEELTYAFARAEVMESRAAENADMTLTQIKATYNRAYDLCLYKLDRIDNAWITASNFLISIVMLIVTILFWMEFR